MKPWLPLAALLAATAPAHADSPITIRDAWLRATPPAASTTALYMTLTSPTGDRLLTITTKAAQSATLHETQMDGPIMRMRPLPHGLALPAGQPVTLAPGGTHIMLEGLTAPLTQGQTITLHLTFQHASPVDTPARVRSIGGAGMGM